MALDFPPALRTAVARGLTAAFGVGEPDSIVALGGGLSGAGVFRIRVGGIAYLLRLDQARDGFRDPQQAYECMRIAAAGLLAPRVRYADPDDGVAIMDFVDERPLSLEYRGTHDQLVVEVAQTVRALHGGPPFPPLVDYLDGIDALVAQFQARGLVAPAAMAELLDRWRNLRARYRTDPADLVASHNDLNPRNVLYDGSRLWLVDWESAFLADRYVDLSCVANLFAHTPADEDLLLATYFGAVDAPRRARLQVMRQVNHLFYGLVMANAVGEQPPAKDLAGRSLAQLHEALSLGEPVLDTDAGRFAYVKARLAAALDGLRDPQLEAALAVIA
ncbi:MAG: aminoglycoside phosphotransferase [Phenylobacterium sp.]|uniref:phosphotransferase n=1 Tax=Phenylobacterium sp. TaxID=1871053 RepID=UPI0025EF3D18|nr:phosphotransferase [Phenylobacterium sp.]MBA4012764.1 aminoglycoside phosphotransferase [Phenylobacterium sp.]